MVSGLKLKWWSTSGPSKQNQSCSVQPGRCLDLLITPQSDNSHLWGSRLYIRISGYAQKWSILRILTYTEHGYCDIFQSEVICFTPGCHSQGASRPLPPGQNTMEEIRWKQVRDVWVAVVNTLGVPTEQRLDEFRICFSK